MGLSLFDLITNCLIDFASIAFTYATNIVEFLVFGITELFRNESVISYETFLTIFAEILLVVGIGFSVANWAISANEGNPDNIMNTFKNCALALFASLSFVIIPVNLLKFTCECCSLIIRDMSSSNIQEQLNSTMTTDTSILGKLILPIFAVTIFVCMIKIFLSNLKRGGTLIILLTVAPMHIFNIPRGYTDGFFSWCKQIIALCLTTFTQNFLVALSFLVISSAGETIGTTEILMSLGISLAAFEAPRIMQQFGMDTTLRTNMHQALYAVNSISSITRRFG